MLRNEGRRGIYKPTESVEMTQNSPYLNIFLLVGEVKLSKHTQSRFVGGGFFFTIVAGPRCVACCSPGSLAQHGTTTTLNRVLSCHGQGHPGPTRPTHCPYRAWGPGPLYTPRYTDWMFHLMLQPNWDLYKNTMYLQDLLSSNHLSFYPRLNCLSG